LKKLNVSCGLRVYPDLRSQNSLRTSRRRCRKIVIARRLP
jgi:hypothetical protein